MDESDQGRRHTLAMQPIAVIGRGDEVEAVRALLRRDDARLVAVTPAPAPGLLRPMVLHDTAYRGPVGTIPAPAWQTINARAGGIGDHICGSTRVTDRGAYRLEISSAAQDPRCFRPGQEITLEIAPGTARTRDGRPVTFISGGDVMLDIGLGG